MGYTIRRKNGISNSSTVNSMSVHLVKLCIYIQLISFTKWMGPMCKRLLVFKLEIEGPKVPLVKDKGATCKKSKLNKNCILQL